MAEPLQTREIEENLSQQKSMQKYKHHNENSTGWCMLVLCPSTYLVEIPASTGKVTGSQMLLSTALDCYRRTC